MASEAPAAIVSPTTRRDLLRHLGAPEGTHLAVNRHEIAGEPVAIVVHRREVPLDDVSERLAGAVVPAPEPVLLGASGTRAAILGGLPDPILTTDEVFNFVQTLLEHDRIALDRTSRTETGRMPTHAVRSRGGKKVLTRLRFLCHCHDRVHL